MQDSNTLDQLSEKPLQCRISAMGDHFSSKYPIGDVSIAYIVRNPFREEIADDLNVAEKHFAHAQSRLDKMLAEKNEEERIRLAGRIDEFSLNQPRRWMRNIAFALGKTEHDVEDLCEQFLALDTLYDAMMTEIERPRQLKVHNQVGSLLQGRRQIIANELGLTDLGSVNVGSDKPFSLAYDLVQNGKLSSTRDAALIVLTKGREQFSPNAHYLEHVEPVEEEVVEE